MVSGGYDDTYQPLQRESGFYQFQQGLWTNYNSAGTSDAITTPAIRDLTSAAYDPLTGTTYLVSFGEGILLRDSEGAFSLINNTSMQTPFFGNITVALTDVVVDLAGNAWFTQYEPSSGGAPLHLFTAQGWQSFPSINSATNRPLELLIDLNAYKWIRLEPSFTAGGLWVIDETNTRNKYLNSTIGNLNNERVLSMVQDKEGTIWLGTEDGVMVVFDSFNVFNEGFQVTIPTFEGRPLLRNEAVKCIAVDGGNRKWMGTENGVFLFDEEATQLIAHFTTDNSPLLSNNLLDIVIQGGTGEVFFCTDQGIISYRADATEASDSFGDVRIFPNPVRPDFDGMVAIEGLAQNADIRITDISGKLIFRTTANGGTATWNIRDYNGNRAATGVYLVFATNQSGEEATVGKIAVVSNE
ncbi:MAG: T9SS type A sorting domain-containing protein [Thermonemataceae bacterium]